jgi:hypothetical protein
MGIADLLLLDAPYNVLDYQAEKHLLWDQMSKETAIDFVQCGKTMLTAGGTCYCFGIWQVMRAVHVVLEFRLNDF